MGPRKPASPCDDRKDLWLIFIWLLFQLIICSYDSRIYVHTYCRSCLWSQTLSHAFCLSFSQMLLKTQLYFIHSFFFCRYFIIIMHEIAASKVAVPCAIYSLYSFQDYIWHARQIIVFNFLKRNLVTSIVYVQCPSQKIAVRRIVSLILCD